MIQVEQFHSGEYVQNGDFRCFVPSLVNADLTDKGMTGKPLLYVSRYLEKNKARYYDNLTRGREGDISRWLEFFLRGVEYAADKAARALDDMTRLGEMAEEKIRREFPRGESARILTDALWKNPVIDIAAAARICDIKRGAARILVAKMCDTGLLRELTNRRRNRLFVFRDYLDIFKR